MERWAAQVIAFYTASLPANIIEPELDFFAYFYLDPGSTSIALQPWIAFSRNSRRASSGENAVLCSAESHD